eukprot:1790823-Ditylum_brightwellii.AAC.1
MLTVLGSKKASSEDRYSRPQDGFERPWGRAFASSVFDSAWKDLPDQSVFAKDGEGVYKAAVLCVALCPSKNNPKQPHEWNYYVHYLARALAEVERQKVKEVEKEHKAKKEEKEQIKLEQKSKRQQALATKKEAAKKTKEETLAQMTFSKKTYLQDICRIQDKSWMNGVKTRVENNGDANVAEKGGSAVKGA